MGKKQKIFTLFLVSVVLFIVFQTWTFAKKHWLAALADFVPQRVEITTIIDTDGDGLSDAEESFYNTNLNNPDTDGDGYLDGEEVASGYDPRIPSPEDAKSGTIKNRVAAINLTDRTNGRILASLYEGNLDINDPEGFNAALDNIALNTLLDSASIFQPPSVSESEIIINYSQNKKEHQEYLNKLIENIEVWIIPTQIDHMYDLQDILLSSINNNLAKYNQLVNKYYTRNRTAIENFRSMEVPKPWVGIHLSILDYLNQYDATYEALTYSFDDYIKAYMAMQKITALHQQSQILAPQIISKAREEELELPNTGFIQLVEKIIGFSL